MESLDDLGDEGYEIQIETHSISIRAAGELGLVFGAYEFLRRFIGCRFSGLGPDGEFVPHLAHLRIQNQIIRNKPRLWFRGLQFFYHEDTTQCIERIDWMAKNGLNYVVVTPQHDDSDTNRMTTIDPQSGDELKPDVDGCLHYSMSWFNTHLRPEITKRGMKVDMNHHNLLFWLPPHRYFADHPEWYSQINGVREAQRKQLCVCTSNPEAVETIVSNVKSFLRANPDIGIIGIIPEDGIGMCQCSRCVSNDMNELDAFRNPIGKHEEWRTSTAENQSKSNRYTKLLNTVASSVAEEFPKVLIGGAFYQDLQWPARGLRLAPNTTQWVALYWRNGSTPIDSTSGSPVNSFFYDLLQQWRHASPGHLILYEYYMGMEAQRSLPYPMSEIIIEDWKRLPALGVEGATVQCHTSCHHPYALNLLAFAACGWHEEVDHARLLEDFLIGLFGGCAQEIRPIYGALLKAMRELPTIKDAAFRSEMGIAATILEPDGWNIIYFWSALRQIGVWSIWEKAKKAATVPREVRQLDNLRVAMTYWEMAANAAELRQRHQVALISKSPELSRIEEQFINSINRILDFLPSGQRVAWISIGSRRKWMSFIKKIVQAKREQ
jgi:hypothetical protein